MKDECAAWLRGQAEADVKAAGNATPGPWEFEGDDPTDDELWTAHDGEHGDQVGNVVAYVRGRDRTVANGRHMERHDPRTEAARAESVLAVLDLYAATLTADGSAGPGGRLVIDGRLSALHRTVRLLAYGYRYREGWQKTWKP